MHIHRNSASNKINGPSSFSIEEAIKIKGKFFPEFEYRYLFNTVEDEPEQKDKKPTFNDIRKEHGLSPVEGGDVVLTKE